MNKPSKLIVDLHNGSAHKGATQFSEVRSNISKDPTINGFLNIVDEIDYAEPANVSRVRLVQGNRTVQDVTF